MPLNHRPRGRHALVAAATALSLILPSATPLWAANHPNSRVASTHVLDITANVDWDYDAAPPTQSNGTTVLTKEVLRDQILREVARSVFLMTEGRHRIGTVYLYKNGRFGKNVDVQIINKSDRSYASAARWQQSEGSSYNFLAMDNKPENLRSYSRVIAHELGHYVYGFADEYREEGKALNASDPGGPSGVDFTRNSIMNNHENFTRLSLAADYTGGADVNNTAQARVYATDRSNLRGGSHWEMLTRDPASDPAEAKEFHGGARVWFDAFKGFTAPTKVSELTRYFGVFCDPLLVQAACGTGDASKDQVVPASDRIASLSDYNAQLFAKSGGSATADAVDGTPGSAFESFKVVFVDSPADAKALALRQSTVSTRLAVTARAAATSAAVARHAIVIDRSLPAATFEQAIQAAEAVLQLAETGTQWAVITSPSTGNTPLQSLQSIDTGRAALVASVQGLTRVDGRFDASAAFALAQAELSKNRADADSATIELFTGQGSTLPKALGSQARALRTSVNAIGLRLPAGSAATTTSGGVALDALALATGGSAYSARDAEQAVKKILRAQRKAAGEVFSLLATTGWDSLSAASTQSTPLTLTPHDQVISAHWNFDPVDKDRLSFRLVTPAGTFSTLSPASNLSEGYALIELDNSSGRHNGSARALTLSSTAVSNSVGLDVQTESVVQLSADVEGGTLADNREPVLRAQFTGQAPVAKARLLATVYRVSDGVAVLSDLVLADDGQGVDARADDGRYAISLKGLLPAGDYTVEVYAQTTADSVFQPNQIFAIGSDVPVRPVGAGLVRVEEADLTLDAGATGVLAAASGDSGSGSTGSGGSGGCTSVAGQRDAGLVLLLLSGLTGLWLRRRSQARRLDSR
ncbi:hypothetical protein PSQ39_07205 [Curvibacter sp. HBC28]|uniref:Uncharacterized protein n=1 Tax=Curvibacter microcysteis TaxID=3026419 RepID=A0ABT5MCV1_9BURK|nr:choice-of-anchor X domain-containing protein [Curvibacter sp. HBC28]MDD0814413.1 hypothetical protein [Curvibacter sp. HBC28]